MAINFPTSLDALTNPVAGDATNSVTVPHATQHANANDAIEALEARVGITGSAVTSSLTYRTATLETFAVTQGAWTAYTPTWAATGTAVSLGNGTVTGKYMKVGRRVDVSVTLTAGSTTTFGTGVWTFTLPFTAVGVSFFGVGRAFDTGVNTYNVTCGIETSTTMALATTASPIAYVGPTNPFTWASTDILHANLSYESTT